MIFQRFHPAESAHGSDRGRESTAIAPATRRVVMGRTTWRVHDRHRPTRRTSCTIGASPPSSRKVSRIVRSPAALGAWRSPRSRPRLQSAASLARDVVPPVNVALGSRATDPGAAGAPTGLSIDVPGVVSVHVGLPAVATGAGEVGTGLVAAAGDVLHTLDGAVAGVANGPAPEGAGGGISSGGGSGPGSAGTSISHANPGVALTLPGLSVDAELPHAAVAVIGGSRP